MTDCEKQIGYVIFDCVCLMLGAAELRAGLTAEAAEEMAEAAKPVLSKMEEYVVTIASEESSKTEVAGAVFGVVSTIWSGGCLGAVVSAWLKTLSVGNAILYGATALGTLLAAFATDGAATIGMIVVELATCAWLVEDSVKCADACSYA
jgi:hypothetical protein